MGKTTLEGFENTEPVIEPFDRRPEISDDIQQGLDRLLAWDDNNNRFRLVRLDADGRLLVSSGATQTDAVTHSNTGVTFGGVTLIPANPNRKAFLIRNIGTDDIWVKLGLGAVAGSDLLLQVKEIFIDDLYTGVVTAMSPIGIQPTLMMEWV